MSALLQLLTGPEWSQVVKTLLHSLWQGALIAVALALTMRRVVNPHWRYRFSLGTLAAIPVAGIITWAALNASNRPLPIVVPPPVITEAAVPATALSPDPQTKVVLLANHSPAPPATHWTAWLALLWIAGAVAMLGRAGIKLAGAEQLRRSCRPLENSQVTQLLAEASRAIGLAQKIRVTVTDKLTSPAVVGVMVPTLILPLSLVTTLTPEQIRFILLHELAHIRRGDYFANLFQLFVEALLFFNPAVWWISHQVRREREACCDALAIELSGAPTDYARTLIHVAENALEPGPAVAPAFGGGREPSSLADRVQRLLVPGYRPSLRLTWRAMIGAFVLGATLLLLSAEGTRVAIAQIAGPQPEAEKDNSNDTTSNATADSNELMAAAEIVNRFAIGDQVTVAFSGTPDQIPQHEERIRGDGSITLPLIGVVIAAGKTPGELQKEIHDRYVPAYYKRLTVIVTGEESVSFLGGRVPARVATDLSKAIQSAGDFTDWRTSGGLSRPGKTNPSPIEISGSTQPSRVEYNISAEETKRSTTSLQQVETLPLDNTFALSNHFTNQFNLGEPKYPVSLGPRIPAEFRVFRTHELDGVLQKLHDMRFQLVACSNKPLGELFRELSEQSEALAPDGVGFMFSVIPIRLRTIPATIDPPLTNASLSEILEAIQGAPQLRLNGVNTNGLVTLQTIASFAQSYPKNKNEVEADQREPHEGDNHSAQTIPLSLGDPANANWAPDRTRSRLADRNAILFTFSRSKTNAAQADISQSTSSNSAKVYLRTNLPPIEISGSQVDFDPVERKAVVTYGGIVRFNDTTIRADSIQVNQKTGDVVASGNVRLEQPGRTNHTTKLELNIYSNQPPALFPMIFTNEKRRAILNKLNQIKLERVAFDEIPLSNVVLAVSAEAQRLDPEGRGVRITINSNVNSPDDGRPVDVSASKVSIDPPLTNVRLMDALDAILKGADKPLKLTIEEYGVAISLSRNDEPSPLFMRQFKVDPGIFARRLAQEGYSFGTTTNATEAESPASSIRSFLVGHGVGLEPTEGKSIYFNHRGMLLVRATTEELDQVEKLLVELNRHDPQINIKIRFVEVTASELETLVPDLLTNRMPTTALSWVGILTKPQMNRMLQRIQTRQSVSLLSEGEVTTLSGRQAQIQEVEIKTIVTDINSKALTPPGIISTNKNGSGESLFITTTNLPFGPTIDIVPAITPDGYNVALTVIPRMTEFLGYDGIEHPTNTVAVYENGKKGKAAYPLPRFRTQQMTNSSVVRDGMTLMLAFPPVQEDHHNQRQGTDIPVVGRLFRSQSSQTRTNILFVLVTPTIVDPAAKRSETSAVNKDRDEESFVTSTNLRPIIDMPLY